MRSLSVPKVIRFRRWLAVVGPCIGIGVALWLAFGHQPTAEKVANETAARERARLLSSVLDPHVVVAPAPTPPAEPISSRVEPLMRNWRTAIINKDADTVEALDRTFASFPREFTPALMTSAQSDPEERVRSFSTRVLGKLRPPESVELMRRLLADRSEYVRFNAAWALGELADHASIAGLRLLQQEDPSSNVRRSAEQSLRKMQGG